MVDLIAGVAAALLIAVVLWWVIKVSATIGPHCRCGHHRSVHRMPDTGCVGRWSSGRNAVGAQQWTWCPCRSYRPTEVGWWQRVSVGTEEHKLGDYRESVVT